MGIRPSYIVKEKQKKVNMLYDLYNIKTHVFEKPLYIVVLILLVYIFSFISVLLNTNWYVLIFSFFGWLSIIAIVSLIIAHSIIVLIRVTDGFSKIQKILTFLTLPISYCLMRFVLLYLLPIEYIATTSLLIMLGSTIAVIVLIKKIKTNKFKTTSKMKDLRVEDGPRRNIRK